MPGSEGRKMFIVSAESPARRISVAIFGGVRRSRNTGTACRIGLGYASGGGLSIAAPDFPGAMESGHAHLRKMKKAPTAMQPKPRRWFHIKGSFRYSTEKTAKTDRVITSWIVFSSAAEK